MNPNRLPFDRLGFMALLGSLAPLLSPVVLPSFAAASAAGDTPPAITLRVLASSNSHHLFVVETSDADGIAQVILAVNGEVLRTLIHKPWRFEFSTEIVTPFEVCAEAMDRSGNASSRDCKVVPGPTPCRAHSDCESGQFCYRPAFRCEGLGGCQDRPYCPLIPPGPTWSFACGCNGRTYPSFCEAAQEGVNVAHPGPCK